MRNREVKSMKKTATFFQDDSGKPSPSRLLSFTLLLAAIGTGFITFNLKSKEAGVNITYSLIAAAFGTKGFNKFLTRQDSREALQNLPFFRS
ncbi:MAG: hypothetical protein DWQ54_15370 [Microcystis flos-aquae TF09]|uniref:Uncharacterized protein n=2 Tax=Microcystis TaxID=1125 RepID=A0A3E0L120_9CHRO|nr:MAG: hypothetical protein DWQ54_15370 [Microcystis flos-aquae TF09]